MKGKTMIDILGTNIKILRVVNGLSQKDLAERSGVAQQLLSRLENGIGNPSLVTVGEIAKALGTNVQTLLNDYILKELYIDETKGEEV